MLLQERSTKGLAGRGQYTLDKSFQGMSIDAEDMDLEDCYPPAEIVEKMVLVRKQTDRESNIAKMNGNEQIHADEMEGDDIVDENEKDEQDKGTTNNILPSSQVARAQMIVDNNKCIYQPEMKVFTVQGTCDVHAVKSSYSQNNLVLAQPGQSVNTLYQQSCTWDWIWGRNRRK